MCIRDRIKILLACGAGASSGFLAQGMRKAAKKQNLDVQIKAVSDIEILNYVDEIDLLMIGPHIKHRLPEFEAAVQGKKVILAVIDQKKYSMLDGAGVLEDALTLNSQRGKLE